MNISRLCFSLLALATISIAAFGDEPIPDLNKPQRIELSISPAAEPRPALKYSLAISARERQPGNAAPFYNRALLLRRNLPESHRKEYVEHEKAWVEEPLTAQSRDEIKKWLSSFGPTFHELKVAVYREHCDWDFRMQDLKGMEAISFLLPELQDCRDLSRVLRLKAHLEVAEKRYDEAFETLRWGFQLAKDCGREPILISNLVGIAIASSMIEPLTELMKAPGAPNLYWAIAILPQPFIDTRKALDFERGFTEQIFPFLKDAETVDRSPQEWQRVLEETVKEVGKLSSNLQMVRDDQPEWVQQAGMVMVLAKAYPSAKAELIKQGMTPQRVEAMSVAQVIAIQTARTTREIYDEVYKATLLPYPESLQVTLKVEELKKKWRTTDVFFGTQGLPFAESLMPSTLAVKRSEVRLPIKFAALQVIEAIRMHAAATGKLPASLREITVVPVPLNPFNREPFPYELKGNEAVLDMPALPDEQQRGFARRYIITLAK